MLKVSAISLSHDDAVIPGILILGDDREEVLTIAEMTRDHYELPGPKEQISVAFADGDDDKVDLSILFDPRVGDVKIIGANREVLDNLISGLKTVENYVVLLGYDHNEQNVVDPNTFSLIKNDLLHEGQFISGQPVKNVDWTALF